MVQASKVIGKEGRRCQKGGQRGSKEQSKEGGRSKKTTLRRAQQEWFTVGSSASICQAPCKILVVSILPSCTL